MTPVLGSIFCGSAHCIHHALQCKKSDETLFGMQIDAPQKTEGSYDRRRTAFDIVTPLCRRVVLDGEAQRRARHRRGMFCEKRLRGFTVAITDLAQHPADCRGTEDTEAHRANSLCPLCLW